MDETASVSSQVELGFHRGGGVSVLDGFLPRGSSVVVRKVQSDPRGTTGGLSSGSVPLHGRFRCGVGSLPGRVMALRKVDTHPAYIRKAGGTNSHDLNVWAQQILRTCENHNISLAPQFVAGALNVVVEALNQKN